eukprot:CAMPEP_0179331998 /NCGR_PEP_ID=MMETSP0797-20121207/64490_1 /TAXON_ID=47934 /ORGANISM="Dinophysis acuminata, Strain DAEP01" /LENGTH=41 /DNA_ID= /DNA_START= /DNA_END= /DNA_ORIENTATION=
MNACMARSPVVGIGKAVGLYTRPAEHQPVHGEKSLSASLSA